MMPHQQHCVDTKDYLSDLINHYTKHLEHKIPISHVWGDLITEERNKCIHKLHRIKEMDAQAFYQAKNEASAFASLSPCTKSI